MNFFGLDIGSHKIKIARIKKRADKAHLVNFGMADSPTRGLLSEAETDLNTLSEAIKKLYLETKVETKNVAVALPEDQVFTRVVTFPKLSESELRSAIKWEAEQYVPIPLSEVNLDYQLVGKKKEAGVDKVTVLLVAAPRRLIEKLMKVIKTSGLNPVALETEIIALSRSLTTDSETCLLVDLGARATDMAVVDNGLVAFTRSISAAGEAITRALATSLNMDPSQAEEYKKAYGVDPKRLEGKIKKAIDPVFELIKNEMEKAIQFYQSAYKKQVKRVILTGGTSSLPEVVSLLAEYLNVEIQVGDPLINLAKEEILGRIPAETAPLYAVAIGLALKDL